MILYRIFLSSLMKTISNQSKFQKNSMCNNNPKFSSLKSEIIMNNKLTLVNMKKIRVRNSSLIIYLILIWKVCPTSLLSKKIRILTPMSTLRICLNKISNKMNKIQLKLMRNLWFKIKKLKKKKRNKLRKMTRNKKRRIVKMKKTKRRTKMMRRMKRMKMSRMKKKKKMKRRIKKNMMKKKKRL